MDSVETYSPNECDLLLTEVPCEKLVFFITKYLFLSTLKFHIYERFIKINVWVCLLMNPFLLCRQYPRKFFNFSKTVEVIILGLIDFNCNF